MAHFFYHLLQIILFLILPFIFLIRGSVYVHDHYASHPWIALFLGIVMTVLLLVLYMTFIYGKLTGRFAPSGSLKRRSVFALILVLGYSLYGLFYFSNANAKADKVQKEYTSLHPILRLSISTLLFFDKKLIITDANRRPEDYRKMGLPSKKRSLHYEQSNGFVHAIDIRTKGRSEVRNFLIRGYFWMMGLNTLRHNGTDDHLHVSLKSHDHPLAI